MMSSIVKTIRLLFEAVALGISSVLEKAKATALLYLKGLLYLAIFGSLLPIVVLIVGIYADWQWLILFSGFWSALFTTILLYAASPIGILIEALTGGMAESSRRYLRRASVVPLIALCLSLFAMILPLREHTVALPLLILLSVVMGMLQVWVFQKKVVSVLVTVIFFGLLFSFFFPNTFEFIRLKAQRLDVTTMTDPQRAVYTADMIMKDEKKFFGSDGSPLVWYDEKDDTTIELFDKKGVNPFNGRALHPVTRDVVDKLKRILYEQERRKQSDAEWQKEREGQFEKDKAHQAEVAESLQAIENTRKAQYRESQAQEEYRKRYVSRTSETSQHGYALFIIDDIRRTDPLFTRNIASQLQENGLTINASLFTEAFGHDGVFDKVYSGSKDEVQKLHLVRHCDKVLLGKKDVRISPYGGIQGKTKADATIQFHVIEPNTGVIEKSFTIHGLGIGDDDREAEGHADRLLLKDLKENPPRLAQR